MASFLMEDFVGNGCLKNLIPVLVQEGWEDVPTLKIMKSEDMESIKMTQQEKDALEIRTYLHDHALIQYGDKLEASGQGLPVLLNLSPLELSSKFGMKRGHVARFKDQTTPCAEPLPAPLVIQQRRRLSSPIKMKSEISSMNSRKIPYYSPKLSVRRNTMYDKSLEQSILDLKNGQTFKGIVAAVPAEPRACGCVSPPPEVEIVAPYSAIKNISVQKLTPEYRSGMELLSRTKTPPMKASELWKDKPAVLLCIRRPGCIMCRAEAHKLYSKKPIFDALGIQLFAVLHEHIESEVKDFWPRYWGGAVIFDRNMEFFKALGGGKLLKDKFLSGFILNPRAIANYKRAKATRVKQNFKGNGEIKGGLFILGSGKSGIAYQFIERNFGDWAPLSEVIEICSRIGNQMEDQSEKSRALQRPI